MVNQSGTNLEDSAPKDNIGHVSSKNKVTIPILIAVITVLCVVIIVLIFTKVATNSSTKDTNEQTASSIIVCDDSVVTQFNELSFPLGNGGKEQLTTIIENFSKNTDYTKDPTCGMIAFNLALENNDINAMDTAISNIESAYTRQQYANGNLYNLYSLQTMKNIKEARDAVINSGNADSSSENQQPADGTGEINVEGLGGGPSGAYDEY